MTMPRKRKRSYHPPDLIFAPKHGSPDLLCSSETSPETYHHPATLNNYGVTMYKPADRFWDRSQYKSHVPLLLDLDKHRLFYARRGKEGSMLKCNGNDMSASSWYFHLPEVVQQRIDEAGFGIFIRSLAATNSDHAILTSLGERWSDTTHTLHFSTPFEMTMTPVDFSAITGLRVGGEPIPLDALIHKRNNAREVIITLLGEEPPGWVVGKVRFNWLITTFAIKDCETKEEIDCLTRAFLLYLFGTTIFSDTSGKTVPLYYLSTLKNLNELAKYDWGGVALATMYRYMDAISRGRHAAVSGFWRVWEIWAYEYGFFPNPAKEESKDQTFPRLQKYTMMIAKKKDSRDVMYYRGHLNNVTEDTVLWQPWGETSQWPSFISGTIRSNSRRCLLSYSAGFAWYLAERVSRQSLNIEKSQLAKRPPLTMLTDNFSHMQMITLRYDTSTADIYFIKESKAEVSKSKYYYVIPELPTSTTYKQTNINNLQHCHNSQPCCDVDLPILQDEFEVPVHNGMLHFRIPMPTHAFGILIPSYVKCVTTTHASGMYRMVAGLKKLFCDYVAEAEQQKAKYEDIISAFQNTTNIPPNSIL